MAVLHDDVRAEPRAATPTQLGHRAYALPVPASAASCRAAAERALLLGFDTLLALAGNAHDPAGEQVANLAEFARAAHERGLSAIAAVALDTAFSSHPLGAQAPLGTFTTPPPLVTDVVDPRRPVQRATAIVRVRRPGEPELLDWWRARLAKLHAFGLNGVVTLNPSHAGRSLMEALSTPSFPIRSLATDEGGGENQFVSSTKIPVSIATLANVAMHAAAWAFQETETPGLETAIRAVNRLLRQRHDSPTLNNTLRTWTGQGAHLELTTRATEDSALLFVKNHASIPASWPPAHLPPMPWQKFAAVPGLSAGFPALAPGDILVLEATAEPPAAAPSLLTAQQAANPARRIAITRVSPSVDAGAFAIKRVVGETIQVEADIFADGHEQLAAAVLLRAEGETAWQRYSMAAQPNDVWTASLRVTRLGQHSMAVQAWLDVWGGFVRDLSRKCAAGQNVDLEIREARALIAAAHKRAPAQHAATLEEAMAGIDAGKIADPVTYFGTAPIAAAMQAADNQPFLTTSFVQPIVAEREAAKFSSWYELFPRSQSPSPDRHGTFADAAARLPHIAAMGFDTLYFPPIHPIGERNRKGPNNSVTAAPGDLGSPYAIGSRDGGHDAIHPDLGDLDDFHALLAAAAKHGIEIAMDFAIQCAPDHPWLSGHPGWFDWRPDGSIKYAENPPKKYQDIVNVDFYAEGAVPELWNALRDVVLYWAEQGVRSFRVDNPHTKPLPFWSWVIAAVKARFPDAIFLSEAFTRPKPMYQLAKAGFSQSYTYFTWRNDKAALTEYLLELTQTDVRDFFRPHFFVNTPDINPLFLQSSGRAGFLIRAALAATLSGLWGVYAGFELCESAPLPDREEYLDSEKYQIRRRPDRAAGDIVDEITVLNRLRRSEPALQSHLGLEFHNAYNDNVLYYSKAAPGQVDRILVAVSLDPHHVQEADFEVPLWLFGLADWQTVTVTDLLSGRRFTWPGKWQHVNLAPESPYAIWRIAPQEKA